VTALERWTRAAPAALLAAEFVVLDAAFFVGHPIGLDARIYLAAARAWLSGGDPWATGSDGVLLLYWAGAGFTLEEAPSPIGPWAVSSNQSNPRAVFAAGGAAFYRLRR
jgi:hypothetical protein